MRFSVFEPRTGQRPLVLFMAVPVAFALSFAGCGPSFEAKHAGDVRFEHCYALDEGDSVAMDDKANCWQDYQQNYSFGQTRDRLTYAARRAHLLARSQSLPTDETMMEAAPGQILVAPNAPAPSNAFAPPPQMMSSPAASAAAAAPTTSLLTSTPSPIDDAGAGTPPKVEDPGSKCAEKCGDSFHSCESKCDGDSDKKSTKSSCGKCSPTYKHCMSACYR
jgi:hypothetical protein